MQKKAKMQKKRMQKKAGVYVTKNIKQLKSVQNICKGYK